MPKGTCQAEAMSNSEQIKPIALAVLKSCLSEGISQLLTQSVENSVKQIILKFRNNLLKVFQVYLKAYLGLVSPNHTT